MKQALAKLALQAAVPVIEWLAKHAEQKIEDTLASRKSAKAKESGNVRS